MKGKIFQKKDNEKRKNTIINVVTIAITVLIIGALAIVVSNNKDYHSTNPIKEVSYAEYISKIKDDDYTVVLLAAPDCSHCQNYKPFVKGIADEYGFEVYYLNVHSKTLKNEDYDKIHDSVKATSDQFSSDGEKVIPTPTTVIYKSGVEVDSILGDIGYEGLKSFLIDNGVIKDVK